MVEQLEQEGEAVSGWAEERCCASVCLYFSINLLLFHCRVWCPLACHRFDSPSERSASSHGSLWRGGSWSCCLPNPTQWSPPFLSTQKKWEDKKRNERGGEEFAVRYFDLFISSRWLHSSFTYNKSVVGTSEKHLTQIWTGTLLNRKTLSVCLPSISLTNTAPSRYSELMLHK